MYAGLPAGDFPRSLLRTRPDRKSDRSEPPDTYIVRSLAWAPVFPLSDSILFASSLPKLVFKESSRLLPLSISA